MTADQPSEPEHGGQSDSRASAEDLFAKKLESPTSVEALYLEEANPFRPIATGDVFRSVRVPGSTDEEAAYGLTVVVAHPSGMRKGALLELRAQAAPALPVSGVRRTSWTEDRFDIFPLPCLAQVAERNGFDVRHAAWAADLRLCGPIATAPLDVRERVACLAPEGLALLLQRLVHTDTRSVVPVRLLGEVFKPKLEEIELLESWTESALAGVIDLDDAEFIAALRGQAAAFEEFMNTVDERLGVTPRVLIEDDLRRSEGRQLVEAEIERRDSSRSTHI